MSNADTQAKAREPALVLIVDDEAPLADALAYIVEDAGYKTLIASHGRQALALAREHHPALVITDLMMPHLDGTGLIAALRADAARDSHIAPPIILLTAGGMQQAHNAGADVVIRKPFDIAQIEELLERFLGQPDVPPNQ